MKTAELREKSTSELTGLAASYRHDLFKLRMQLVTGQLPQTSKIRVLRREIARVETLLHQRQG